MTRTRRHIILVSIDTLRADCIGASPRAYAFRTKHNTSAHLKTDPLNRVLKKSMYYNTCFSAAPYTSASHAAYFTGLWPRHNGIYEFFNRKLAAPTIFTMAKERGYTTLFQTDFPVILGKPLGFTEGIDLYFIEDEAKAFNTLKSLRSQKTLSFFHFAGVHYPYGFHTLKFGGDDYRRKVRTLEKKYGIRHFAQKNLDDVLDETFRGREDSELLLRYKFIIQKLYGEKRYDDLFGLYLEGINYFMEHRFMRFISGLTRFADREDAILFLFADHGEEWDADSEGHHNSLDDSVLRVPLMVYGKGIRPGIEERMIRTIDVAPTIMTLLAGGRPRAKTDGMPLDIFGDNRKYICPYALAQVWMSIATKRQIAAYQKASMKSAGSTKPLRTYLYGEVIRTKKHKLTLRYDMSGSVVRKETSGTDVNGSRKTRGRLKKILADYNKTAKKTGKRIGDIESKIRSELISLGYRV